MLLVRYRRVLRKPHVASLWLFSTLARLPIGINGLAIVLYVAASMIWDGARSLAVHFDQTQAYNAAMPSMLDIKPAEEARRANP